MGFLDRVERLPHLGIGISTEYGAGETPGALDPEALARAHPEYAGFLEIGIETHSGLDEQAQRWIAQGRPHTYHFLDVNLEEPVDLDEAWLAEVRELLARMQPAWMCGDAGMWHFGGREPGHMLLLPPVLCEEAAQSLARGVRRLRDAVGLEVIPENPPGVVFLGDMHLLDFFARACTLADTGMLLDCAHLAIYQRNHGHAPLTGLDRFPLERIVELHVAGGTERVVDGMTWINDDHTTRVLPETWEIFEHLAPRCPNLRAVVFECERNALPDTLPGFARIRSIVGDRFERRTSHRNGVASIAPAHVTTEESSPSAGTACNELQRVMVRMLYDSGFVGEVLARPEEALTGLALPPSGIEWLRRPDPRAWHADPERPGRARKVLLHEFAASLGALAESSGSLAVCDRFFRSREFHDCIQSRGSLALCFGAFLQEWAKQQKDPRVGPLAHLETEIARLRRQAPSIPDSFSRVEPEDAMSAHFRFSCDHLLLQTAAGAAALHEQILQTLAQTGAPFAEVVLAPPPLPFAQLDPCEVEHLLLELDRTGGARSHWLVGVLEITEELFELLARSDRPRMLREIVEEATALGADEEAEEIAFGLIEEGLLVPTELTAPVSGS